jgi:uncharacterized protein (TIGR02231 family)
MKKIVLHSILFIFACANAQKPIFTTAKVKSATVYFGGAEILENTTATLPTGTSEVVIKNIANNLNESTIQIGAPASVTVLSVQFTNNYISEYEVDEKSPVTKKVRDSIKIVENEIKKNTININSHAKTLELLDKNQQVFGVNSGMSVLELTKMVGFYQSKFSELNTAKIALEERSVKLNELLSKLNNKLEINTSKEEKISSGKLVLQIMNNLAGVVPLDITYITNSATWNPFYDLRAENVALPINMMYKAQVTQNSGIDWKKVKLTLSSGNPNQSSQAPTVNPWFLSYYQAYANYDMEDVKVMGYSTRKKDKQMEVAAAPAMVASSVSNYTKVAENQLNISFDIDIPYDILSNGKLHSVALKEIKLPATYKYFGAPKLDKEAFLLAEINDYSKYNLLPGEANIIFEGMYVGKTNINPNQTTDTLNLSMGRDKKISIKREKITDKSGTKFLSSYKEQTFTYDISVRNNKKEAVVMQLKDQYPLSTDKEITIELLQSDKAKVNAETGIVTWDLKLAPNETKKIRLSYLVKYPKDKVIGNL